jgi:hypothetical protein
VQNLDRQVVAFFPQQVPGLLLENNAGAVMGIDDVVPLVEVANEFDLPELLEAGVNRFFYCFRNLLPPYVRTASLGRPSAL